jgi:cyclophilin family peptidyl-prolyl cis-trans isomerase
MNTTLLIGRLGRLASGRSAMLALLAAATLAGCGGGSSGDPSVTTITASGMAYSRTMTVTVNGAGLSDLTLFMTVEGAGCVDIARTGAATDSQVQFTCTVTGVGEISPRIRRSDGRELGRVTTSVPMPQVSLAVRQGTRSSTLLLEIDPVNAPLTAANFMRYVNTGFYRDTLFHRIVQGKLAQGGGFSTGPVAKTPTFTAIPLETRTTLKNLRGTIAMARTTAPDSAQSQFYLNVVDNPEFDRVDDANPGYAVFGRVVSGLDALDELGRVETTNFSPALPSLPVEDVVLTSALQVR